MTRRSCPPDEASRRACDVMGSSRRIASRGPTETGLPRSRSERCVRVPSDVVSLGRRAVRAPRLKDDEGKRDRGDIELLHVPGGLEGRHVQHAQGTLVNPVRVRRAACVALSALVAASAATPPLGSVADASAAPRYCKPRTKDRVRVIQLRRTFGCRRGLRLAAAVVNGGGYYQDLHYYCRFGQGGTRPVRVHGHTYYGGFCYRDADKREATFLARRIHRRAH